jgi:enoyl-CoA hydratase
VPSLIDLRLDGHLAVITLDNPAKRNAMTRAMWRELRSVVHGIHLAVSSVAAISYKNNSCLSNKYMDYRHIRCIIVKGEGSSFCAGGDISEYPEFRFNEESLRAFHEDDVAPALHALLACDVPIVAQIQGPCMGGGLEIAACCDVRIAGEGATFGAPIAKLGMPMAPQELAIVLHAAGQATVRAMLLEARVFSAQQMERSGFVQQVVADTDVAAQALASAQRIASLSPQAARLNKQTIRQFYPSNMPVVHAFTAQTAINNIADTPSHVAADGATSASPYVYAASAEHVEGITAFLEKRTAQF